MRFPPDLLMTQRTHHLNMGYWRTPEDTLDDASENLALLVAQSAGFAEGDRVLDNGFGYGDQDFLWLQRYKLAQMVGLKSPPSCIRGPGQGPRAGTRGPAGLPGGSATGMQLPPGSFMEMSTDT
jgi:erythromycin 3''-O-methyltransferase